MAAGGEVEEYDWIVVGSGFGGSVSALRLAEKGYSVGVIECGRRYEDEDFAKSTWRLRRYYWMPKLGLRGIFRLTTFKDILIVSGSGVGGGSLGYANTLYRASPAFFTHPQWDGLAEDWDSELRPHYDTAERMLGVTTYEGRGPADELLHRVRGGDRRRRRPGPTRASASSSALRARRCADPYFGGEGPARTGCVRCGQCMIGCRYGAKNTLRKNYLWFAEKLGVKIHSERQVVDVQAARLGRRLRGLRDHDRARRRGPPQAAPNLPRAQRRPGGRRPGHEQAPARRQAPRLAARASPIASAHLVRTNSESILAVTREGQEPRFREVDRDHLVDLPGSRHARRGRDLREGRRLGLAPVHAHDRRRHQAHPPDPLARPGDPPPAQVPADPLAGRLVGAHRDPARHAVARQRDAPGPEAEDLRPRRPAPDRAGPGAPQPDLHPRGEQGRRVVRGPDGRHRRSRR